jgi:beta-lactamase superfamily II metal-dependent hydrolase
MVFPLFCTILTFPGSTQAEIHFNRGFIQFFENSVQVASIDINLSLHPHKCHYAVPSIEPLVAESPFVPPTLGVTFLGTSHGFDAKGHTTGFIIWINGEGIMVDPPIHTTSYLRAHGIKPSFANKVILTHCHSDHDSGREGVN